MRIALDTGGTFTDCVFVRGGRLEIVKVFSTPANPAQAISDALDRIFAGAVPALVGAQHAAPRIGGRSFSSDIRPQAGKGLQPLRPDSLDLTCGTTVGTNALLQRRGGRVALVTTAGFEDVLEIGRQARPRLYDFFVQRPEPLVPAARRFGLHERTAANGKVLLRPSRAELSRIARAVQRTGAQSVAVCLLFSYANPAHEQAIARVLRAHGLQVSVSHEILPEFREFERTSTTVINAYLAPVMSRYLAEIERQAATATQTARGTRKLKEKATQVRVMQSSGGIISAAAAAREPVRTILSGPAGGILGAQYVAGLAGFLSVITFDMGGTSTDVALLDGPLRTSSEATVAELPVAVPILDIHTVGAGGGSLARFDRAGALRVGPESAGADPGPICYGRGTQPTVTDAHLVLGHIPPDNFLGGEFLLDEPRARKAMQRARGKMRSLEIFAQGILDVANATMEKAIRVTSIERGYDPRDYTLVAFGGAGGLHACDLASALRMPGVLIPKFPGALSALGILRADVVRDFSRTVRLAVRSARESQRELRAAFAQLVRHGIREMAREGFSARQVRIERLLDARYIGQAYELAVPASGKFITAFHHAHEQRYGYSDPQRGIEIVNVRARLSGATPKPALPRSKAGPHNPHAARIAVRRAFFAGRAMPTTVYQRDRLRAGHRFTGPAIVVEYSATTVIPPGWRARVDVYENILLESPRR